VPDDYYPIVEQGELELASGLRARLRRREELALVGPGFERVLLAEDGTVLLADKQLTPGERRNIRARSWIRVDVGHHRLDYSVSFSDPSGRADFLAAIAVDAAVVDAVKAIRSGISSIKDSLEPALRRAVVDAGEAGEEVTDDDEIAAFTDMRLRARAAIRKLEGEMLEGLPGWLSAKILSTTVDFADGTQGHYKRLVELAQQGSVIDRTSKNNEKRTEGEISVRKLWREDLLPGLSNSSQRDFERVFANPTAENIAIAVGQANQRELALLQEVVGAFEMAAKEGFIEKDDPTIRALVGFVGHLPQMIAGSGQALPEAKAPEVIEADPAPEEQVGDRDFSD
jgi:hypothetical protein